MNKLIIKNGVVFDPINEIEGEVKDILIENGKIVEKFSNNTDIKEINASNKTLIPAAVDIHCHVASQQTNWIRLLGSKNELFSKIWNGFTLESIARNYISNGYTFILEANTYPSLARQTIFNFNNLPVLDKGMLLNLSNLWQLETEFQRGKIDELAIFISDLLSITKGFGIKAYNPFESEDWNFKHLREDLSQKGRLYNFTPLDVYENLIKTNELLKLPHSAHIHVEGYETDHAKTNLSIIIDKIKSLNISPQVKNRNQIAHFAHASTYNINSDNKELINAVNESKNIDLDLGFLTFNEINPLITSDRRLINSEIQKNQIHNIIRSASEFEGDSFSALRTFNKKNKNHLKLWANAFKLALKIKDKWKIQLSINFPNYGHINDIPKICSWLMSFEARKEFIKDVPQNIITEIFSEELNESLSFNDFVIISRASPAKSLGLGHIKGNLGIGADGDLNILDININELDPSMDYLKIQNSLGNIHNVIKSGNLVKQNDKVDLNYNGKIFYSSGNIEKGDKSVIMKTKTDFYTKFYSYFYDTLKIELPEHNLRFID